MKPKSAQSSEKDEKRISKETQILDRKKYLTLLFVIVLLLLLIGVPLLINWIYAKPAPIAFLDMKWSLDTALLYYGSIVAGIMTVCGVFFTIRYSQSNYQEDVKNRVLPIFSINTLYTSIKPIWDSDIEEKDQEAEAFSGYSEYDIRNLFITVEDGNIIYRPDWTKEQRQLLQKGGVRRFINGVEMQTVGWLPVPIEVENVGNGPALNVLCGFFLEKEKEKKYMQPIPIKAGDKMSVHIFFENAAKDSSDLGKYTLELIYQDIIKNRYCQIVLIELMYESDTNNVVCRLSGGEQRRYVEGRTIIKSEESIGA